MNPALEDFHHKRDSDTLNAMQRTNEYDTFTNGYSVSDQTMRNFSNSKNLQPGSYSDRHYSHLQSHTPAMSGLQQFLPTPPSLYHQPALDPAFSYNSMLSSFVKAQYDFNPYSRPNTGLSPAYSGLGQTAPRLNIYPDFSTADPEMNFYNKKYPPMYPSSPLPVPTKPYDMESHLMPRYHRNEEMPGYMNNYPRTHSVPNKPYLGNVTDISRSQPAPSNGIKHGNNPVIDLTSPTSPENFKNPSQRSDAHLERSHTRSSSQDIRNMPKENGSHHQAGTSSCESRSVKSHHHPHSSDSMYSNLLSYTTPQSIPPFSSGHQSHSENSLGDMRAFSKPIEPAKPIMHSPWGTPNKHHNPSPRQMSGSELSKKSLSPSSHILSKDIGLNQSEITFNYPEASVNRYEGKNSESRSTPSKRNSHVDSYGQRNEHDKYNIPSLPPRSHSGNKSNESALSPFEHYVIEKAREGKLPSNVLLSRKFDDPPSRLQPYAPRNHPPSVSSPKDDCKRHYENEKEEIGDLKNPMQTKVESSGNAEGPPSKLSKTAAEENVEKTHQELDPVKSDLTTSKNNPDSLLMPPVSAQNFHPPITGSDDTGCTGTIQSPAQNILDQASSKSAKYRQKKSDMNADGTPRVKRPYVKKSKVWDSKGKRKKKDSTNEISHKASDSTNCTAESKSVTKNATKVENATSTVTVTHPVPSEKLTRPQRKSTGLDMDEYLYGYVFSDEETENDDSSDEDYSCPSNVNKIRVSRQTSKPLRRTRRSTRSQNDAIQENEESNEAEVTQRKRRKRRPKCSETTDSNKPIEQDADTAENIKNTPIQNPILEDQPSVVVESPCDKVCPESQLQSRIITQEMAEEMVKQINIASEVKDTLCDSATKTEPNTDIVPTTVPQTNSIPLNELKYSVAQTGEGNKKRKYRRRLDENGNPIKRMRKIKSAETIPPKPRRKYEKKAKKWFIKKIPNQQPIRGKASTTESKCHQNTALSKETVDFASSAMGQPTLTPITTTDPVKVDDQFSSVAMSEDKSSAQPCQPVTVSEKENIAVDDNVTANLQCDTTPHDLRSSITTEILNDKMSAQGAVKIRKKPGRKPGWRKYPARDKDASAIVTAALKMRKKSKNTGDGLKWIGRRKKGKRGRRRMNATASHMEKHKLLQATPITSTPTSSKCDNNNTSLTRIKRKYDNTRRLEKKHQRLMSNCQEKELKRKQTQSAIGTRNHSIHKISLELQNQEYLFDSKDVSWHHKVQGNEEFDSTDEPNMEEVTEQAASLDHEFSKCETPASTLTQSPFPSSLKKLTCNSAIGETMLHKAARLGYTENVQYYLESGANVNQCDNAGYTALHKACVHNNLEAASLLLEYGADVNKHAADGTRPFHDAVEYDHLEMTRLMLASGADPLLSKFSGRAVLNMIRSEKMGKFMNAYLQELKEPTLDTAPTEWKFQRSAVFETQGNRFYRSLDFAPEPEELSTEFELYEELPIPTYLLQPDDDHEWSNFYLLDDYLNCTNCKRNREVKKVRIITMSTKKFLEQVKANKMQYIAYERAKNKPDISSSVIEIVAVEKELTSTIGAQTITTPLFSKVTGTANSGLLSEHITGPEQSVCDKSTNKNATIKECQGDIVS